MQTLRTAFDVARSQWPQATPTYEAFKAHVEQHDALESAHLADLYLTLACGMGDAPCIRHFQERFSGSIRAAAQKTRTITATELGQKLHSTLMVATPTKPVRITTYSGRGRLETWVRVILARLVIDHARTNAGREEAFDDGALANAISRSIPDPEVGFARAELRQQVRDALEVAFGEQDASTKTLLRYRYVDGIGVDEVAKLQNVHRATAARRIAAAEEALQHAVHQALATTFQTASTEVVHLLRSMLSQLDFSIDRLLQIH